MMEYRNCEGEFYLPNCMKKYSGRIVRSETENFLEIYSDETIDGCPLGTKTPLNRVHQHPIIVGNTFNPNNLTLVECKWVRSELVGKNLFRSEYRFKFCLFYVQIENVEKLQFKSIAFKLQNFTSWYNGYIYLKTLKKQTENDQITIAIDERLTLTIYEDYSELIDFNPSLFRCKKEELLTFNYSTSTPLDVIITDIVKLKKLIEFSLSDKVNFSIISGKIETKNIVAGDKLYCNYTSGIAYFENLSSVVIKSYIESPLISNSMLLSGDLLKRKEINTLIVKWFDNSDYYYIYDLLIDSNVWFKDSKASITNVMFNNRCLNLIQALESFHKKSNTFLVPEKLEFERVKISVLTILESNKELKKWVNDRLNFNKEPYLSERLEFLVESTNDIWDLLFSNTSNYDSFPSRAKDFRNKLSHANIAETNLGDDFITVFHESQLLMTVLVLRDLGFDNNFIIMALKKNLKLNDTVNEIKFRKLF